MVDLAPQQNTISCKCCSQWGRQQDRCHGGSSKVSGRASVVVLLLLAYCYQLRLLLRCSSYYFFCQHLPLWADLGSGGWTSHTPLPHSSTRAPQISPKGRSGFKTVRHPPTAPTSFPFAHPKFAIFFTTLVLLWPPLRRPLSV